ncbi:OOP family OmpA-OmpF porin [Ochrobactrum sp. J50]|uniref:BON domain-containing protein n=1 Tax=Brucella/Ochrobactrum group TaxID=2826938 RepID=UPI0011A28D46|nr:BON domain-containing protein [Ochrobactrum sp. J50]TWH02964.1 OOP family OmpA-OmpF porin [Ochrobactrum sp. J50]WPM80745.1 BON domain-containing protein [Brucella pseudintermedia]
MFKWLWPGLTWTAALTALALWFGADQVETDIATRTGEALSPFVWAGFDVEGRDVTLKGIAPDPEAQSAAKGALEKVWGIREVTDLTSVLPLISPYALQIKKNADIIILSGSVPDNDVRDRIMTAAENVAPGIPLDDEMAVGRGSPPNFADSVEFALQLLSDLREGEVRVSDLNISIKGRAADGASYQGLRSQLNSPLPFGLKAERVEIGEPELLQ